MDGHRRNLVWVVLACASVVATSGCAWVTRVNVTSTGGETHGTGYPSAGALSEDGRYEVFGSLASDQVPGDTNSRYDVFLRDNLTGAVERVSVSDSEAQGTKNSVPGGVSDDARYVSFVSGSANLVAGDTNGANDVFLRDRVLGTTTRINVGPAGQQADGHSFGARLSANGRWLVFSSDATNLVAGDTNGSRDVFLWDRTTGDIERVSVCDGGGQADSGGDNGDVSDDGNHVAFWSESADIIAENGAVAGVYVLDRSSGGVVLASVDESGLPVEEYSDGPLISGDGSAVAFYSDGALVAGDGNFWTDAYVWDRATGAVEPVSVADDGTFADVGGMPSSISDDGRFVAFDSDADNLVTETVTEDSDVFVRDRLAGATYRVSESTLGMEPASWAFSTWGILSGDGRVVAFESDADDLVPGDTNGDMDLFMRDVLEPEVTAVSPSSVASGSTATLTVTGARFLEDASVVIDGNSGIVTDSVAFVSDAELEVEVHSVSGPAPKRYTLFVMNPSPWTPVPGSGYGAGAACWGCVRLTA